MKKSAVWILTAGFAAVLGVGCTSAVSVPPLVTIAPASSATSVPLSTATSVPLPTAGGAGGTIAFSPVANSGAVTLHVVTATGLEPGAVQPQLRARRDTAGTPTTLVTIVFQLSSPLQLTALPQFTIQLPSGVPAIGPFELELFDQTTGTLLAAEPSANVSSSGLVTFAPITGTVTLTTDVYDAELVKNSTQTGLVIPSASPATSASPAPTATPTPGPTATPTGAPTATPTLTAAPTATPTPKPSATATPAPTSSPIAGQSPAPTATPTKAPTATPTPTAVPPPSACTIGFGPGPNPASAPTQIPINGGAAVTSTFEQTFDVPAVCDFSATATATFTSVPAGTTTELQSSSQVPPFGNSAFAAFDDDTSDTNFVADETTSGTVTGTPGVSTLIGVSASVSLGDIGSNGDAQIPTTITSPTYILSGHSYSAFGWLDIGGTLVASSAIDSCRIAPSGDEISYNTQDPSGSTFPGDTAVVAYSVIFQDKPGTTPNAAGVATCP